MVFQSLQKHFLLIYHLFLRRPQLHPQKVSGLFSPTQARGPKSHMTDGEGLTTQALLLAAGVGLKLGLDRLSCYSVPPGTKLGPCKMAADSLSPALSPIIFSLGYRVFLKIWKCHQKIQIPSFS